MNVVAFNQPRHSGYLTACSSYLSSTGLIPTTIKAIIVSSALFYLFGILDPSLGAKLTMSIRVATVIFTVLTYKIAEYSPKISTAWNNYLESGSFIAVVTKTAVVAIALFSITHSLGPALASVGVIFPVRLLVKAIFGELCGAFIARYILIPIAERGANLQPNQDLFIAAPPDLPRPIVPAGHSYANFHPRTAEAAVPAP